MTRRRFVLNLMLCVLVTICFSLDDPLNNANGAEQKRAAKRKRTPNPAMTPIKDNPALPRVLLIGDSISIGYTVPVRQVLADKANVHRPLTNCGHTTKGLESLDAWLGDGKWDIIHFNWGLHDLKYIEGEQPVPLAQYEKNMTELVKRLKKTGARLIWCSTTPVPKGCSPPRSNGDVIAYNKAAKRIMDANDVAIDDLYGFALPRVATIQLPKNVHFGSDGSVALAKQVARSIFDELKK